MKITTHTRWAILALTVLTLSSAQGAAIFDISVDTSALIGNPAGPFSLDFQFTDGSATGDANNSVTLSALNFNGGGLTGSPALLGGASAGPGFVSFTDSAFLNEYSQSFTPGSLFQFTVTLSTAVDAGGTPDQFSFAILEGNTHEIPTTGLGDAFLTIDLNSANPSASAYGSDLTRTTIQIGAPSVIAVPEPVSSVAVALAVLVLAGIRMAQQARMDSDRRE